MKELILGGDAAAGRGLHGLSASIAHLKTNRWGFGDPCRARFPFTVAHFSWRIIPTTWLSEHYSSGHVEPRRCYTCSLLGVGELGSRGGVWRGVPLK